MIQTAAYRMAECLVPRLPRRAVTALALLSARMAFALRVPARRAVEANLAPLLGRSPEARGIARQSFEQFARAFVEFIEMGTMPVDRLAEAVELQGEEHLEEARASGRGVIVLSAHLGNWEWGAAALATRGVLLHVAARRHSSAAVEAMFERRRRAFGLRRLDDPLRWSEAARLLRGRQWLGLMGDRGARPARRSVCAWAAALASRTGAVVLPALTVRTGESRYALIVEPALSAEACAAGGFREAMRRHVERHPGQWCAFEPAPGLAS
jgi:KDO2-lipid IV(A) lauroyltransferase